MDLFAHTLSNGIRLVHAPVTGAVAHCGIFINAGSRDEPANRQGIAHFIEHTIFKGTAKRSLFQVLNRLECVGADLNAYTTKEETGIHASFLCEHYDRTLELYQDILFHSRFPEKEIENEKQVVMDEIRSYLDTPAEQVFDDFEDLLFAGHPLGWNILGTMKSVKALKREDILDFIHRNYRPERIVIASASGIDFRRLVRITEKYFGMEHESGNGETRRPFEQYRPFLKEVKKRHTQVHCIVGAPAYPFRHELRIPMALLNNMLGGPMMSSRLSMALRERNGVTYHCESNYTAFSDTGLMQIYFGTDPTHYEKALAIVDRELKRLREEKLSGLSLHHAKRQLSGQLTIARESNMAMMLAIGKSYLLQDRFDGVEEIMARIDRIKPEELLMVANEVLDETRLSRLTFMP